MSKMDRRILKSQEAIKKAFIELMSEKSFDDITIQDISDRANVSRGTIYLHYMDKFDLLDKLMESHINELRKMYESATEMNYISASLIWFKYFESNCLFFSTMLANKGDCYFHKRFFDFIIDVVKNEMNIPEGKGNYDLKKDTVFQFIASAYVGIVEWWFTNEMPYSPQAMAEQVGNLLERNYSI